jgi:photosystem II stability/assembly factor-like uncharacterized protein
MNYIQFIKSHSMKNKAILTIITMMVVSISLWFINHEMSSGKKHQANIPPGKKLKAPEIAYYHAGWEYLKTRDPKTGNVPFNIRAQEMDFVQSIPDRETYLALMEKQSVPKQYQGQTWKSEGPDNVCGRILAVAMDLEDENIILAGSASGGLWRTEDGGNTWSKTTAPDAEQSVTCLVQDPRSGKTDNWYYGTGELTSTTNREFSIFPRTIGYGNGIYKSTDNGLTWSQLLSTSGGIPGVLTETFQGIWNVALDVNEPTEDILYVAGYGGIERSDDGGETWTHVLGDLVNRSFCTDVAISSSGLYYAALGTFSTNEPGNLPAQFGLYQSTDGNTWENITPEGFPEYFRTIKLAIPPSNPNALYVFTENPKPDTNTIFGFTNSQHTLWKGTDLDTENPVWVEQTTNLPGKGEGNILVGFYHPDHGYNSIGGYAMSIDIHPDDEDLVFIGGTNCYRSPNAFEDSTATSHLGGYPYDGTHNFLHPDQHGIAFSNTNPSKMLIATDGGIYKTTDLYADSVLWDYISNGLICTQFYWVGIDHAASNDDFILGGCQDNAVYYHDSYFPAEGWQFMVGGDGLTSEVADNKTFAVISVYNGTIFSVTFDDTLGIDQEIYQTPDMASMDDFIFYTHFVIDPASGKKFYLAAKNRILRKDDMEAAANDTSLVNTGWQWLNHTGLDAGEFITAIGISKTPANILYYGSHTGKVFRMDNVNTGDPVATECTSDLFPPDGFVGFVEVDPADANHLFVVFSNYNVPSIFESVDGGGTWTNQSGNLEEYPDGSGGGPSVRCVRMVHYDDGTAYFAATSAGLYSTYSLAGDQTIWLKEGAQSIGNVIVDNINTRDTDGWIVVATQGHGIFSAVFDPMAVEPNSGIPPLALQPNFPNPCNEQTTIRFSLDKNSRIQLNLFDDQGNSMGLLHEGFFLSGSHKIPVHTAALPSGTYIYQLQANNKVATGKMVVVH